MKPIAIEELRTNATAIMDRAQSERILITRRGKPCAVVVGVENYDQEDFELAQSADFWRMIEARRKESPSIPLAEVKRQLGITRAGGTPSKSRKKAK